MFEQHTVDYQRNKTRKLLNKKACLTETKNDTQKHLNDVIFLNFTYPKLD